MKEQVIIVSRSLTAEDVPQILDSGKTGAQRLLQVRQSHHGLARLIAQGFPQAEISLITGYSPSYISTIQHDPAFAELLAYYSTQRDQIFVDAIERMKTLGISTLEELQDRLEKAPASFANRELMELVETMLVKPNQRAPGGGSVAGNTQGGGVNIQVKFVQSAKAEVESAMIDVTPTRGDK